MWPLFALLAMGCFSAMQLLFKYFTRLGLAPAGILVFVFGFAWILYVAHIAAAGPALTRRPSTIALLFLAGLLGYVGNLFAVRAVGLAPNAGYAVAIFGLQALVVTGVSVVLLGGAFTAVKLLGVLLCCAGVALLVL